MKETKSPRAKPISGGYILQPRCVKDSDIAHAPPHVREIWFWMLREANHADTNVCRRGQLVRTYSDIQEDLHWMVGWRKETYKKHHCEIAMKWLRKADMITTRKTTRGVLITIVNYDKYQDPANYESYTKTTGKPQRKLQPTDTINKNGIKQEEILTEPPAVNKNVGKLGIKSAKDILAGMASTPDGKKHPANYWQERALHFIEKLQIPQKDHSIVFRYFKQNLPLMESICSYVLESPTPIKNPTGYVLSEFKRRGLTSSSNRVSIT